MSDSDSLHSHPKSRRNQVVRLAYTGRTGTRWTYSPSVVHSQRGALEVSMLVPLAVGHRVDVELLARDPAGRLSRLPRRIGARVTGCQSGADGLFRIRLAFPKL